MRRKDVEEGRERLKAVSDNEREYEGDDPYGEDDPKEEVIAAAPPAEFEPAPVRVTEEKVHDSRYTS